MQPAAALSLWISASVYERIEAEANQKYPLETGGVLVGYVTAQGPVVTAMVGPGGNAEFRRRRFSPDSSFQEQQIAALYESSGRIHTYLGDWHTHPDGIATPSWLDRRTLRRIARSPSARAPEPAMAIFAGKPERWKVGGFRLRCLKGAWLRRYKLEQPIVRLFEPREMR